MVCTSDSGMKLYEIEEYSDHEYITGYHAWNVTYFIDVIYGADMHYYISMKRGFIMTPETEIVKKQILSTENAEILLEEMRQKVLKPRLYERGEGKMTNQELFESIQMGHKEKKVLSLSKKLVKNVRLIEDRMLKIFAT